MKNILHTLASYLHNLVDMNHRCLCIIGFLFIIIGCTGISRSGSSKSGYQNIPSDTTFSTGGNNLLTPHGGNGSRAQGSNSQQDLTETVYALQEAQDAEGSHDSRETVPPNPEARETCGDFPEYTFNPNEIEKVKQNI